jgi:hypothetical protein
VTHDDFCRLSRAFNQVAHLGDDQDYRINEWLKAQIEASQRKELCQCEACGRMHWKLGFNRPGERHATRIL